LSISQSCLEERKWKNGRKNKFCWYKLLVKNPTRTRETNKSWNIRKKSHKQDFKAKQQTKDYKKIQEHGNKTNIQSNVRENTMWPPKVWTLTPTYETTICVIHIPILSNLDCVVIFGFLIPLPCSNNVKTIPWLPNLLKSCGHAITFLQWPIDNYCSFVPTIGVFIIIIGNFS